ncbi:alginate export family protein [Acidobacteriia bacterium AH_259_A11_L15]|nr:alginate export family protein [Acidobacteriia bacterium AH_259_A11_L15]
MEAGIELRWRNEFRENGDFRSPEDFDHFLGQRLRIHLRVRAHAHLNFYVEGQDVWLFGAERDKIIHNTATNLHQAYLDWRPGGSDQWSFRAGRQELSYGDERLVGAFGWDNVGRSFDAARLRYRTGAWVNDFFWSRLVDVPRGGAPHRPGNRDLYGNYLTWAPRESPGRVEFYGFFLRDGLRTVGERPLDAGQATRIFTLGFRRSYEPSTDWRYGFEHTWQFGHRGPDRHRAAMLVARGAYAWGGDYEPRVGLEYDFATGDDNRADGNSREFNNLFPTNHKFYGYADLLGLRNLHALRLSASVRLHPRLRVDADYHRFLLVARRGPWKNAGGRVLGLDPTGEAGRDLGQEVDLTFRVLLHSQLSFMAGYSVFLPGRFAARTRGPETHHFGYIQTMLRF